MSFEQDWANYDSGPFCKHWSDPGSCSDCARELVGTIGIHRDRKICGICDYEVVPLKAKYCPGCGRRIEWKGSV